MEQKKKQIDKLMTFGLDGDLFFYAPVRLVIYSHQQPGMYAKGLVYIPSLPVLAHCFSALLSRHKSASVSAILDDSRVCMGVSSLYSI